MAMKYVYVKTLAALIFILNNSTTSNAAQSAARTNTSNSGNEGWQKYREESALKIIGEIIKFIPAAAFDWCKDIKVRNGHHRR